LEEILKSKNEKERNILNQTFMALKNWAKGLEFLECVFRMWHRVNNLSPRTGQKTIIPTGPFWTKKFKYKLKNLILGPLSAVAYAKFYKKGFRTL